MPFGRVPHFLVMWGKIGCHEFLNELYMVPNAIHFPLP